LRGAVQALLAQTRQRALVRGDESSVLGCGQQLGIERVRERGLFFVQLLEFGFVGVGEFGARV